MANRDHRNSPARTSSSRKIATAIASSSNSRAARIASRASSPAATSRTVSPSSADETTQKRGRPAPGRPPFLARGSEARLDRPAPRPRIARQTGDQAGVARPDEQLVDIVLVERIAHPGKDIESSLGPEPRPEIRQRIAIDPRSEEHTSELQSLMRI